MTVLKPVAKFMAKRCDNCPLCRHARENPATIFGLLMALHGKVCPFWRAWEKEYGGKTGAEATST